MKSLYYVIGVASIGLATRMNIPPAQFTTSTPAQEAGVAKAVGQAAKATTMTMSPLPSQGLYTTYSGHNNGVVWTQKEFLADQEARKLAKEFADAKEESKRSEIKTKLAENLDKQFDEQQKRRQEEITKIEEQVAKLKETLKKRGDQKRTIIDRRVDQMLQDAEGLGWSSPNGGNNVWYSTPAAYSGQNPFVTTPVAPAAAPSQPAPKSR